MRILTAFAVAGLACGCASQDLKPAEPPKDPFTSRLEEYAESASRSLRVLAEVEQRTGTPSRGVEISRSGQRAEVERRTAQPAGLDVVADLQWSGPLEDLVRKIADSSGYIYKVSGAKPALPILVSLATSRATYFEALQDVGFQAGDAAAVIVRPSARVIEIRYPSGAL